MYHISILHQGFLFQSSVLILGKQIICHNVMKELHEGSSLTHFINLPVILMRFRH